MIPIFPTAFRRRAGPIAQAALAAGLLALSGLSSLAWAQPASVTLTPRWEIAERVRYAITSTRVDRREGQPERESAGRSVVEIVGRSADAGQFRHEWRYESVSMQPGAGTDGLAEQLMASLKDLSVQLRLDGEARVVGLENADEVRAVLVPAIGQLVEGLEARSPRPVPKEQVQRMLMGLMSNEQQLLQVLSKEAQVLYAPYGGEFTFATTRQLRSSLQTPFSPQPIATDNVITVSALQADAGTYELTMTESLDPADVSRVLSQVLAQMAKSGGMNLPPGQLPRLQMNRQSVYRMALGSRWPLAASWEQTIEAPGGLRRETMRLELLTPQPPAK